MEALLTVTSISGTMGVGEEEEEEAIDYLFPPEQLARVPELRGTMGQGQTKRASLAWRLGLNWWAKFSLTLTVSVRTCCQLAGAWRLAR